MHLPIHTPFVYFSAVNRAVREDHYLNLLLLLLLLFVFVFAYVHCFKKDILHVSFWLVTKNK